MSPTEDAAASALVCGGRMEIQFRTVAAVEDGKAVVHLVPHRALWDGQPVSDIVAEALAIAWCSAEAPDEDDSEQ
ncbi:hypothetical protein PV383_44040 [Streptomyces caniscabiei]|uniref:Uncharacterized protein n=1 Tax=Streptomyces caniscabiei TaxID=2746961 RepID=A0ABU4N2T0_9ACTN|nr:hypothetical protein [Streptomyces caniscabiei]MDX3044086.1 hypothetical protein [Streptomyces caniscabiei]